MKKTKPAKAMRGRKVLFQTPKPLETHPTASGYNPTVVLRCQGRDYIKIDLWAMAMLYAPKEAMSNWNSFELYLDDRRVG